MAFYRYCDDPSLPNDSLSAADNGIEMKSYFKEGYEADVSDVRFYEKRTADIMDKIREEYYEKHGKRLLGVQCRLSLLVSEIISAVERGVNSELDRSYSLDEIETCVVSRERTSGYPCSNNLIYSSKKSSVEKKISGTTKNSRNGKNVENSTKSTNFPDASVCPLEQHANSLTLPVIGVDEQMQEEDLKNNLPLRAPAIDKLNNGICKTTVIAPIKTVTLKKKKIQWTNTSTSVLKAGPNPSLSSVTALSKQLEKDGVDSQLGNFKLLSQTSLTASISAYLTWKTKSDHSKVRSEHSMRSKTTRISTSRKRDLLNSHRYTPYDTKHPATTTKTASVISAPSAQVWRPKRKINWNFPAAGCVDAAKVPSEVLSVKSSETASGHTPYVQNLNLNKEQAPLSTPNCSKNTAKPSRGFLLGGARNQQLKWCK